MGGTVLPFSWILRVYNMQAVLGFLAITLTIFLFAGACAWCSVLWKKGVRGIFGYEKIVVQAYNTVVIYKDGLFADVLSGGVHWLRAKSTQMIYVDMRPEPFIGEQWVKSGDNVSVFVKWSSRGRVEDPKCLVENTKNYGADVFSRMQSAVKTICSQEISRNLQDNMDKVASDVVRAASESLALIGYSCIGFEFLEIRPAIDLDEPKEVGFMR